MTSFSASTTSVDSTTSPVTLIARNDKRMGLSIVNTDRFTLHVLVGDGVVSTTNYSYWIEPGEMWECPFLYTGNIQGVWSGDGSGAAKITEYL